MSSLCPTCYQKAQSTQVYKLMYCIKCRKPTIFSGLCNSCYASFISNYFEENEMKKASFQYEASVDAYKVNFSFRNYKRDLEGVINFIKTSVPSAERTYDPKTYTWYINEKYYAPLIQVLLSLGWDCDTKISKKQFEDFKKKQEEAAKAAGHSYQTRQRDKNEELSIFREILSNVGITTNGLENLSLDEAKKLYRRAAILLHPDRNKDNPIAAEKMSILNSTWTFLQEGYYIK